MPTRRGEFRFWAVSGRAILAGSRKGAITAVPKLKSIFDMEPDTAHEARLDAESDADYEAGRVVPHGRVREWLRKLARGERVPPPDV